MSEMTFNWFDVIVFVGFIVAVVSIGLLKSKSEKTHGESGSEDYFLAGRGLKWWLIGFSLIAANISTEQFVGMSGSAASHVGLAIASYEWMAAITLVVVGFVFLPHFLKAGIYTIPEFLEYRYTPFARTTMAAFTMVIYVGVTITAVIYSGAVVLDTLFHGQHVLGIPVNIATGSWAIGIIAALYVAAGGLKACAWADLLQGSALIVGGAVVLILAFNMLGKTPVAELATTVGVVKETDVGNTVFTKFMALNHDRMHMFLPAADKVLPWTALCLGLWIPNFYYWGLNQYITQRTLGAKSLGQGQKGIVFAAGLKLVIPFVIVIPGIIAYNLYSNDMASSAQHDVQITSSNEGIIASFQNEYKGNIGKDGIYHVIEFDQGYAKKHQSEVVEIETYNNKVRRAALQADAELTKHSLQGYKYDAAFGLLIKRLIPSGLRGFLLAAILGAVVSSLASMLNSASTIFTMDIYKNYINKVASQFKLVTVGRICVVIFVCTGCLVSPILANPKFGGVFKYIQEFQGFISPGILAVFVFGLIFHKAPRKSGAAGLWTSPILYSLFKFVLFPNMAFLNRMAFAFFGSLLVMGIMTLMNPLKKPVEMPENKKMELESSKIAKILGGVVIVATIILYIIFR